MRKILGIIVIVLCVVANILIGVVLYNFKAPINNVINTALNSEKKTDQKIVEAPAPTVNKGWQQAVFPDIKLSFYYPDDWQVDRSKDRKDGFLFGMTKPDTGDGFNPVFASYVQENFTDPYANLDSSAFNKAAKRDLESDEGVTYISSSFSLNQEGRRFYSVYYTQATQNGRILKGKLTEFFANGRRIEMYLIDDPVSLAQFEPVFDSLIASVRNQ